MDAAKTSGNVEDKGAIDIFLFSNGQQYSPPRKYHLKAEELKYWDATLGFLARSQYGALHTSIDMYTIDGRKIQSPEELRNYAVYVAVKPPDTFIHAGYDKYLLKASRSWEKRQAKKSNNVDVTNPDEILAKQEHIVNDKLKDIINVPTMDQTITETIVANRVETDTHKSRLLADLRKIQKAGSPRVADKKSPVRNLASQRPNVLRKVNTNVTPDTLVKKPVVNRREPPKTSANNRGRQRIPVPTPTKDISKTMKDIKFTHRPAHVPAIAQKVDKFKKSLTSSKSSSSENTPKSGNKTEPLQKPLSHDSYGVKIEEIIDDISSNLTEEQLDKFNSKTTMPKVVNTTASKFEEITTIDELEKTKELIDVFKVLPQETDTDKTVLIKNDSIATQNTLNNTISNLEDTPTHTKSMYEVPVHEDNTDKEIKAFNEVPSNTENEGITPNTLNNIALEADSTNVKTISPELSNIEAMRAISEDVTNKEMTSLIISLNKPIDDDLISAAIEASIEKSKVKEESLVKTASQGTGKVSLIDNRQKGDAKLDRDAHKLTNIYKNTMREAESSYNKETDTSIKEQQHNEDQSYFESSLGTIQSASLFTNHNRMPPDDLHSIKLDVISDKTSELLHDVLMIPTPDVKSTPQSELEHTAQANGAMYNDTNNFLTVLNKGDVINLKLNIEVRNANGILRTTQNINTRKSQSSTDVKKDTNDDEKKMLTQSKSLQSVTKDCPPHPCCRKDQKIVVQCPCCDSCAHEGAKCNMDIKPVCPALPPYYVLLPVMTRTDKECRNLCQMCSTSEKQVQNTESLNKVKETVVNEPLGDDKPGCCNASRHSCNNSRRTPERRVSIDQRSQLVIVTPDPSMRSAQADTSHLGPDACFCNDETPACTTKQVFLDQITQTDWCDVLLEARQHPDGHFTFHLPPLEALRLYKL